MRLPVEDFGLPPSGKTSRRSARTAASTSTLKKNSNRFLIDHNEHHQSNIGSMRTSRPSWEKIYSEDSMIVSGGCLKRGRSSDCSRKKSVRFNCQSPTIIRMNSSPSLIDEEKKSLTNRHRQEKKLQINSFQSTRVHLNEIPSFTNHIDLRPSMNRNSISLITNPATITISTDQLEFNEEKPFFLSSQPTTTNNKIQRSTLIISTPPQFHYYLYPSIRSSNGSVNSLSTTSSSNDFDDETCSSSISSSQRGETTFESYRELFRDKPRSNEFQLKRQFFENKIYEKTSRPTLPDSLIRTTIKRRKNSTSIMNMTKTIDFLRDLFPQPDEQRRMKTRTILPTNDQFEYWKEQQRILQIENEINQKLGNELIETFESLADQREIDKLKLHLYEIDTITSVLLKLSSRWSKIENELHKCSDENKTSLLEQRDKIRKKHDEAKYLKEGIDRRTNSMRNLLRKYFNEEQCDDYEYFIRMKSKLILDAKDIEEEILLLESPLPQNSNELYIP